MITRERLHSSLRDPVPVFFFQELEKRGHKVVRYANDFVILVRTQRAGLRVKAPMATSKYPTCGRVKIPHPGDRI